MMKKCWNSGYGLLILRLVIGFAFLTHGLSHLNAPMGTVAQFAIIGIKNAFLAYLATYGEIAAGIFMILGIFTRLASIIITIVMIVAIYIKTHLHMPYLGGYELDIIYMASALTIFFSGPGAIAVSSKVCGCGNCMLCKMKK